VSTTGRFLREAMRKLAEANNSETFTRWARESLEGRARRHNASVTFWRDLADAAPAMGMCATVLGLVRMFAHMTDPALIGAPMATALVATLWGILLANLIAGPVADRLERLSEAELAWQRRTLDHLAALARAELDHAQGLQRALRRSYGT
jgi:chemotaxis protein MotA